jgi:hypothetical protein
VLTQSAFTLSTKSSPEHRYKGGLTEVAVRRREELLRRFRVRSERRAHREEAAQRPRIGNSVGLDPVDDDLVTDVLVDFAAAQLDRFGDCRKTAAKKRCAPSAPSRSANTARTSSFAGSANPFRGRCGFAR